MARTRTPVDPESLPYRPCVGIMVLNRSGLAWAGRRIVETDSEMAGTEALADGRRAESTRVRIRLRLRAENSTRRPGMRSVSLLAEAPGWITYDLPPEKVGSRSKGRYRGQKQRWFAFRFEGEEDVIAINPPPGGHEPEFDAWAWKPVAELLT